MLKEQVKMKKKKYNDKIKKSVQKSSACAWTSAYNRLEKNYMYALREGVCIPRSTLYVPYLDICILQARREL